MVARPTVNAATASPARAARPARVFVAEPTSPRAPIAAATRSTVVHQWFGSGGGSQSSVPVISIVASPSRSGTRQFDTRCIRDGSTRTAGGEAAVPQRPVVLPPGYRPVRDLLPLRDDSPGLGPPIL